MPDFFDYDEVPCPKCGHLNRRFRQRLLNAKNWRQCDVCGVDLATGRFDAFGLVNWVLLNAMAWFVCSLLGVLVAAIAFGLVGWMLLGPDYDTYRSIIMGLAVVAGVAGGIAVAERNRRKGGLLGPKRVASDSAQALAPAPGEVPRAPIAVEVGRDSPQTRAAVKAKAARGWCLALGYLGGAVVGMILVKILGALGLHDWKDTALGLAMVVGLIAGWGWGRWAYPVAAKALDSA